VTAITDMEVTFRQVGAGALLFPNSTDVMVNGLDGFLNQTGGVGSVVTCKFVEDGVWDLIEDVTRRRARLGVGQPPERRNGA
jgi:hypothetical protein